MSRGCARSHSFLLSLASATRAAENRHMAQKYGSQEAFHGASKISLQKDCKSNPNQDQHPVRLSDVILQLDRLHSITDTSHCAHGGLFTCARMAESPSATTAPYMDACKDSTEHDARMIRPPSIVAKSEIRARQRGGMLALRKLICHGAALPSSSSLAVKCRARCIVPAIF